MKKTKNSLLGGATALGLGAFTSKLLGAIYRIPLTKMIGSAGLGLYQMVFPVYCLLLDFSGASVPNALSKLIAESDEKEKRAKVYLKSSLILLFILGGIGTLFMSLFSTKISLLQGNADASLSYIFLAPAVILVCLISCYRGYFQGFINMKPTAISQILEQSFKLILGLILVKLMLPDIKKAVAGATFAITLSELVALIYLIFLYKREQRRKSIKEKIELKNFSHFIKKIVKITIPLTLIGLTLPFSQVLDTFLTVNIIGKYRNDATSLFGVFSGVVMTVINLPVSICYGISVVSIPAISSLKDESEQRKRIKKALTLTFFASTICFLGCLLFAPIIVKILFSSFAGEEKRLTINLLRLTSPCIILLSMVQTFNSVLIGKGKTYLPVISLLIGVLVKTILSIALYKNPNINIYGSSLALIACYFTVCLVNLIGTIKLRVKNAETHGYDRRYVNCE